MARAALKALSRRVPTYTELAALFEAIKKQKNDQAVAILCAALVEDALQDAILARMAALSTNDQARLFEGEGPIGSFSARIKIAFALGVIGIQTRADLNCVRDIRNAFAHARRAIRFTTPAVAAACRSLLNPTATRPFSKHASPRTRYIETAEKITSDLLGEGLTNTAPSKPALP